MLSNQSPSNNLTAEELLERFSSAKPRQKRGLIASVESKANELAALGQSLFSPFDKDGDDWGIGWILQVLNRHVPDELKKLCSDNDGCWFNAPSGNGIDFLPLQKNLLEERYEEADRFTSAVLRELAGAAAQTRGYVYFSEVEAISGIDLLTIDRLWIAYSQGRFGFSVQARLLKALSGRYDRLWPRIGWKKEGIWTRYPSAFDWSIQAPEGHMPLINQLRGVRLMDALLNHPSLSSRV